MAENIVKIRQALRDEHYLETIMSGLSPKCRKVVETLRKRSDRILVVDASELGIFCMVKFMPLQEAFRTVKEGKLSVPLSHINYRIDVDSTTIVIHKPFRGTTVSRADLCSWQEGETCSIEVDCKRGISTTFILFPSNGLKKINTFFSMLMPAHDETEEE